MSKLTVRKLALAGAGALLGGWIGLKTGLSLSNYAATGNWVGAYLGVAVGGMLGGATGNIIDAFWKESSRNELPSTNNQSVSVSQFTGLEATQEPTRYAEQVVERNGHDSNSRGVKL